MLFSKSVPKPFFKPSLNVVAISSIIRLNLLSSSPAFPISLDTLVSIPIPEVLPLESELSSVGSVSLFIWSKPASDFSISLAVFLAALPISLTLSAALPASAPIPAISELIEPIEADISAPVSNCTKLANPSATFCNPASRLLKPLNIGVNNAMKPLPREAFNCSNRSESILVWFAQESCVLTKSPVALDKALVTY